MVELSPELCLNHLADESHTLASCSAHRTILKRVLSKLAMIHFHPRSLVVWLTFRALLYFRKVQKRKKLVKYQSKTRSIGQRRFALSGASSVCDRRLQTEEAPERAKRLWPIDLVFDWYSTSERNDWHVKSWEWNSMHTPTDLTGVPSATTPYSSTTLRCLNRPMMAASWRNFKRSCGEELSLSVLTAAGTAPTAVCCTVRKHIVKHWLFRPQIWVAHCVDRFHVVGGKRVFYSSSKSTRWPAVMIMISQQDPSLKQGFLLPTNAHQHAIDFVYIAMHMVGGHTWKGSIRVSRYHYACISFQVRTVRESITSF